MARVDRFFEDCFRLDLRGLLAPCPHFVVVLHDMWLTCPVAHNRSVVGEWSFSNGPTARKRSVVCMDKVGPFFEDCLRLDLQGLLAPSPHFGVVLHDMWLTFRVAHNRSVVGEWSFSNGLAGSKRSVVFLVMHGQGRPIL